MLAVTTTTGLMGTFLLMDPAVIIVADLLDEERRHERMTAYLATLCIVVLNFIYELKINIGCFILQVNKINRLGR